MIQIGIIDILNSISNVNRLTLNIKYIVKKCRNFAVKQILVSGLVYTKRIKIEILEDIRKKLVNISKKTHTHVKKVRAHLKNFFLAFIDELEKQIIVKRTVEVGQ